MLALRMGRTLSELRREMSASEIMMWAEFDRFSPQGVQVSLNDELLHWEKEQTEGASDPFAGLENALLIVSQ